MEERRKRRKFSLNLRFRMGFVADETLQKKRSVDVKA